MDADARARCPIESITIIGYGLIGASLGLALKQRDPNVTVRAVDMPGVIARPELATLADEVVSVEDAVMFREAIAASELTVLASPVHVVERQLPEVLRHARLVTDCGSTKRGIDAAAYSSSQRPRFVPGHPMAGKTRGGYGAASGDLFEARTWILCPEAAAPDAVATVRSVVRFVGAEPVEMSVQRHDAAVALTSHLPRLLAGLLVTLCHESGAEPARGPAFHSATRVASGETGIWGDILGSNSDELARVAARLGRELTRLASELERGNTDGALAVLEAARRLRD
jgi:prephenate dehydrogenase